MLEVLLICTGLGLVKYLAGMLANPKMTVHDSTEPYTVRRVRPGLIRRTSIETYLALMLVVILTAAVAVGIVLGMMI